MIIVRLVSEEGHGFEFSSNEKTREGAIKAAHNRLYELMYDQYNYKVKEIIEK